MALIVAKTAQNSRLDNFWLWAVSPLSWPLGVRRAFLITLPLSLPLYLLLLVTMVVVMLIRAIVAPIAEFWNAPPEKLRSSYYYGYERRQKRRRLTDQRKREELPLDD